MSEQVQAKGVVFDIQKYSMHDGPGVRTLVFLKGCPLRCQWCSNPESISPEFQVMCLADQCVSCGKCLAVCPNGVHAMESVANGSSQHRVERSVTCIGCGACAKVCPAKALRIAGKEMTVDDVVKVVMEDQFFYMTSGGGVTIGGGEPTFQHDFAAAILKQCRLNGVHTAMETCGQASWETYELLAEHVDLFLFDLKHADSDLHKKFTGVGNERILQNLKGLIELGASVLVRIPLICGVNDAPETLSAAMTWLKSTAKNAANLKGVEVLPYHRLGASKYRQLDMDYPLTDMASHTDAQLAQIQDLLSGFDLPARIVKHA
ncbi:1,2-ethanediol dehydratase-activating enzyme, putative [Syntrophotalea carbinolica DSM 2380]|uniref:1,2-ethanediol dehydratase-activating enzyme, putative n=1 Tax=Syntrophotalea carbinolica (strain DSM 2380 / NBRC 103641 / GraBd1) TaxID=338963 RepID=Q3A611_SYNC1|nr:choline TMA-lyase-activating enzyme [Syntrophotalea carbinolica]ABA88196.1 1,2-ethanediol dehydratase-activating enzyme, putative [Syntrophotalea carbinolica DSM 2380]